MFRTGLRCPTACAVFSNSRRSSIGAAAIFEASWIHRCGYFRTLTLRDRAQTGEAMTQDGESPQGSGIGGRLRRLRRATTIRRRDALKGMLLLLGLTPRAAGATPSSSW